MGEVRLKARQVESSFIEWIGWATTGERVMVVSMKSGKRYAYLGVSRQRAEAMARSRSVGKYYCRFIKAQYPMLRLLVEEK